LLKNGRMGGLGFGSKNLEHAVQAAYFSCDFDVLVSCFLAVTVRPVCNLDQCDKVANRVSKRHCGSRLYEAKRALLIEEGRISRRGWGSAAGAQPRELELSGWGILRLTRWALLAPPQSQNSRARNDFIVKYVAKIYRAYVYIGFKLRTCIVNEISQFSLAVSVTK
jgi:hypothetical protein